MQEYWVEEWMEASKARRELRKLYRLNHFIARSDHNDLFYLFLDNTFMRIFCNLKILSYS